MPTEVERDAALFLEQLYGIEPDDGLLISLSTFKPFRQEFCSDVGEALTVVTGHADIYSRVTLLADRVHGRGKKEDSAAMPAVWMELDVNGGPRSSGKPVDDGFESIDQALEFAGRVLTPSMIVRSGYGLHLYWLLDQLLRLDSDRARGEAEQLVKDWQAQMRQLALEELGVKHFDSSHDLTRVLRPVGSINAKGDLPQEVVLEDFNGTRYSVEELSANIQEGWGTLLDGGDGDGGQSRGEHRRRGAGRPPADLLETFPRLSEIARRKGKAPKDSSGSGWDHYLACEAARCDATDEEIIEVIRHSHGLHGESKDDRYLERTVARARDKVPADEDGGLTVSKRWNATDDPVVGGESFGHDEESIVWLHRRSGAKVRIGPLKLLFSARTHNKRISAAFKTRFPAVTDKEAVDLAQLVIGICGLDNTDDAPAAGWLGDFYAAAGQTMDADMSTTGNRRDACVRRKEAEAQLDRFAGPAGKTAVIKDEKGQVWIPAGPLRASLSPGAPSYLELETAVMEIGWKRVKVELWENPGEDDRGQHLKTVFYVGKP